MSSGAPIVVSAAGVSASSGICKSSPLGLAAAVASPAGRFFLIDPVTPELAALGVAEVAFAFWSTTASAVMGPAAAAAAITPDTQHGSLAAFGTANFKRQIADAMPEAPGFT